MQTHGRVRSMWAALHCSRWRSSSTLGWYSRVLEPGTRRLIRGEVKQTQFLRELYRSVVTNREFQTPVKVSVFKSIFFPIFIYSHKSWVMTETVPFEVQAAKVGSLRRVYGHSLRQNAQLCNSWALNVESPLFRIKRSHLRYFGCVHKVLGRISVAYSAGTTTGKRPRSRLGVEPAELSVVAVVLGYFESSEGYYHNNPPQRKNEYKNEWKERMLKYYFESEEVPRMTEHLQWIAWQPDSK